MTWFNGEQIVERQTEEEEAGYLDSPARNHANSKQADNSGGRGGPNVRRLGEDQPCGGGRRIIRKRIGD